MITPEAKLRYESRWVFGIDAVRWIRFDAANRGCPDVHSFATAANGQAAARRHPAEVPTASYNCPVAMGPWGFCSYRRMAITAQMASTTPKGHAPLTNPYTLDKAQPSAKARTNARFRLSNAYITIMNVRTVTP
jgi:hypothetical protein